MFYSKKNAKDTNALDDNNEANEDVKVGLEDSKDEAKVKVSTENNGKQETEDDC